MQFRKFVLSGMFCALAFYTHAQNQTAKISGTLKETSGEVVVAASLSLKETAYGTVSDANGRFQLSNLKAGKYIIAIHAVGFEKISKEITLKNGDDLKVDFTLQTSLQEMESVTIFGRTANQETNRQAFNVTSIDAKKLHNSTLDLTHALDRVAGVRVRESGGVGSNFNFSLNGFTGRQVKFFIDGVPMDNFGSSFQLNNIPINLADRVEVYKGVVPIWLGSDALGGAINIVTSANQQNYIDASYSFGSFNTHRTTVNAGYRSASGFTVQMNAFQNYSDNNYWVDVDNADLATGLYTPIRVRRFNDTYRNETMIANAGVSGKKYADKLLFGITLGQNRADIQTGARMVSVFGDMYRKGNIIMPTMKYQKNDLFIKGLNVSVTGNFNLGQEQNVDTTARRYNWFGEYIDKVQPGSERERSLYKFRNNNGVFTGNITYQLGAKHAFTLNNVYSTFNRKGRDELMPDNLSLQQPRKTNKNIIGLGYKYDFNDCWNTSVFAKQFIQNNTSSLAYTPEGAGWGQTAYAVQTSTFNKTGYGLATTYFVVKNLQLKASYEKSYRLPENEELFGDLINLEGNPTLQPESSDNYNFGLSYNFAIASAHRINFDGNFIYRNAKGFIRPTLNVNGTKQVMTNQRDVTNAGFDGEMRYSFKRLFTAGVNLTYQNLRNQTEFEDGSTQPSTVYQDRIPNMPFLFGNADASFFFNNLGPKKNTLSLGYNMLYVNEYYLRWPSQGSVTSKFIIPFQISHDVNAVYALANGKYNVALECKNLTDNRLYDNFTLQKPGRGFYLKLRYFITK